MTTTTRSFALLLAFAITGCNSSEISSTITDNDTGADNKTPLLVTSESGGCVRIGPNCARHTLYLDGTVTVERVSVGAVETTGQIDTGQVDSLVAQIIATDFTELRNRLAEGTCSGCVDGVDYEYDFRSGTESIVFSSIEYRFDNAEPLFALANGTVDAMRNAARLEIQTRN